MVSVDIKKSTRKGKKMMAVFHYDNGTKKTIHFGSAGMSDYTIHKDKERRRLYLIRHKKNENWNKYDTAGSLSRWITWGNSTSLSKNISAFKKKFKLK